MKGRILFIFLVALFWVDQSKAQFIVPTGITATGRFNQCSGLPPTVTVEYIPTLSSGTSVVGNTLVCSDPCGKTTLRVFISGITWDQNPGSEWLHGLFLPSNSGYTVDGIALPSGYITSNAGCTGLCPGGITSGPGFYFDNTDANSCCASSVLNDSIPCNNFGDPTYDCTVPFDLYFDLTVCNYNLTSASETFVLTGTSDGATGCWSVFNNFANTIEFTLPIAPCIPITIGTPPVASAPQAICVGNSSDYVSVFTGTCTGSGSGPFWWRNDSAGYIGSGSPFIFNPSGTTCPTGTFYMSCCLDSTTDCSSRVAFTIPAGPCTPFVLQGLFSTQGNCIVPNRIDSMTVTGGVGAVNYTLMPGGLTSPTGTFSGLADGTYTVTATNGNGCTVLSSVTLVAIPPMVFSIIQNNVTCFGANNGQIIASTSFGTAPKTYSISPLAGTQVGSTFSNLPPNTYTISVVDNNSCTASTTVIISQPTVVAASISPVTHVTCFGLSNGSATAVGSGGVPPYTYLWSPGGQTTATKSGMPAGTYNVIIRDANLCSSTAVVTITQPAVLAATISSSTNINCFNVPTGSATVTRTGGTGPFTYAWSPSGGTGTTATGLAAGSYTVLVTDVNGCTSQTNITLTQPPVLSISNISSTNPWCVPANNGSYTITAIGGTTPYSYSNNGGALQAGNSFSGLIAGTYTAQVRDFRGCTATSVVVLTPAPIPTVTATVSNPITCNGLANGSISTTVTGGTSGFTYLWTPSGQTGAIATSLGAGTYSVLVTDSRGCTATATGIVLTQPTVVAASISPVTHVTCFGLSNGSATAVGSGGVPPYTYLWSPGGQTTATKSGMPAGTYNVIIRDANLCSSTAVVTITQPAVLAATISSSTNINCFNVPTGSATVTRTGGTGPFTYAWSPSGGTGTTATGLAAGSYTVLVTDVNGCTSQTNITLTQPPVLSISNISSTNPWCVPANNGSYTITAIGGTTPYSYSNNGGALQAGNSFSGLIAGTYTAQVRDFRGCTATSVVVLSPSPIPTVTATVSNPITCNGLANGSISTTVTGGTSGFTYLWTPSGQTGAIATSLGAGTYSVLVTDSRGCTATATGIVLTQPTVVAASISPVTHVTCFGLSNGSATAVGSGGVPPYTYLWSLGGQTTATKSGMPAGTYNVIIRDANLCSSTAVVTITQPAVLAATISSSTNINCFNVPTGSATVTRTGGTGPFTYAWSPSGGTGTTATGLAAGSYTVLVTDVNGCTSQTNITLTQPPVLSISNISSTNPWCVPANNGSYTITAIGGTTPYSYSNNGGALQAGNSFSGLIAGTYTAQVRDFRGCTATSVVVLTPAPIPTVTATVSNPITCNGLANGSISTTVTGGTSGFTYLWTPSGQTGAIATSLGAGTYSVLVTDSRGCTATATGIVLTQPTVVAASISPVTHVTCFGLSNGSATAVGSGGVPPYTYLWSPGGQTTATKSGMPAGTYNVIIRDANLCSSTAVVTITQPAVLAATISSNTNINCFNVPTGSATVTRTGGTGPFTYAWSPSGGTGTTATGLAAGSYTVLVTDVNGCTSQTNITLTQPPVLSISNISSTNPWCVPANNGSYTITAIGGTTPYSYSNNGGALQAGNSFSGLIAGTYTAQVRDFRGCTATSVVVLSPAPIPTVTATVSNPITCNGLANGSISTTVTGGTSGFTYLWTPSGQTGAIATSLGAGTYSVLVTDSRGCTATATGIVLTQPTVVAASISPVTHVTCFGLSNGSATAVGSGGVPPYTYLWSPGGQTTATKSGMPAGTYNVIIRDANLCSSTAVVTITQPAVLAATISSSTNINCFNVPTGSATVTRTGGTGPFTYAWSPSGGIGTTATGLAAGSYTVLVTDVNGCTSQTNITLTQPPVLSISNISSTNPWCVPANNGSYTITAIGGTTPYSYSNNGGALQAGNSFSGLIAGTYTAQVRDFRGCTATSVVVLTPAPIPTVTATVSNPITCNGLANGSISTTVTGGTSGFTYLWTPSGQTGAIATSLGAGTYSVLVTDSRGCTATATGIVLTQPTVVAASISPVTHVTCFGLSNGSATAVGSGGVPPYTYLWSPGGQTTATKSGMPAGTYNVIIRDANLCSSTAVVTITQPAVLAATISSSTNINCFNVPTGSATVTRTGGTGPFTYAWSPSGGTGTTATGLAAGSYTVLVTDVNGCTSQTNITLTQPPVLSISNISSTNPWCVPANNGSYTITAIGGTTPYSYSNNGGALQAGNSFSGLIAGTYTAQVRDFRGCTATSVVVLTPAPIPTVTATVSNPITCNGLANGSISTTVTGGTSAFTYLWTPSGQTGAIATSLGAGTYSVLVTDSRGCTATATGIVLTQPTVVVASISPVTHVTCFGLSNGSATAVGSGGTGGYTYLWTPSGQTTAIRTGMAAGSYTLTIRDANLCSSTAVVTITQPAVLAATISSSTNINCFNVPTGSATVTRTGGTGPFTYAWSPSGGTGTTATGLAAGSYTVLVTDVNGCTSQTNITLTQPVSPLAVSSTLIVNPGCIPNNNGSIKITASGGTVPAYNYQLNSGSFQLLDSFGSLVVGNYTLTVRDGNNCTTSSMVSLVNPLTPTVIATVVDSVSCNGLSNGSATANISGGTSPYTYLWSPSGQTNATAINLIAGTYQVTGTDINGCSATSTVIITQPPVLAASIGTPTHITCFGLLNGSATASAVGGNGGYTYMWSPSGQTTANLSVVGAGTYQVTITDNRNCSSISTVVISQPAILTASISSSNNINCRNENTGSATVSSTGGSGSNTYAWSPSGGNGTTASGLIAGTYSVVVTDINGCSVQTSVTLTQPANILTISNTVVVNPGCVPNNNGSIKITASGGTVPAYNYQLNSGSFQLLDSFGSLVVGNYTLTVRDGNNCTTSSVVSLVNPLTPTVIGTVVDSVSCNGLSNGSATANISGGTSPYTYLWSPSGQTNATAINLIAGTYQVTGTDINGCSATSTVIITQPPVLAASIGTPTHITCFGLLNGSATASAVGGNGGYTYMWSPSGQTTANLSVVGAGTYQVTITDNRNCSSISTVVISQPAILTASISSSNNINCRNENTGSATVSSTGGSGSNTYAWSPSGGNGTTASGLIAGTYSVVVTDINGCSVQTSVTLTQPANILTISNTVVVNPGCVPNNNGSIKITASGGTVPAYNYQLNSGSFQLLDSFGSLVVGNYTLTVRDGNNCTTSSVVSLVNPLTPTVIATVVDSVSCNGLSNGSATANISGGTSPYTYLWSPSGQTNATAINLIAGTYQVTGTDINGCSATSTVIITQPPVLAASIGTPTHITCFGLLNGSATASAVGGNGGYSYLWSPSGQTTANLSVVGAGTYQVTITDNRNCSSISTVVISQPAILTASISSSNNINCRNENTGSATVSSTGGSGSNTYAWSPSGGNGTTASGLIAGTYSVVVTDINGCSVQTSVTLTQPANILTISNTVVVNPGCVPNNNGSIKITASGGTVPAYNYQLNSGSFQLLDSFGSLVVGNYTLTVRDGNNCTTSSVVSLVNPLTPTVIATVVDSVSCNGLSNGSATANISGGTSPYTYLWSPSGQTNATAINLIAGTYQVTGTDINGCSATSTVIITQPPVLAASIGTPTHITCFGLLNGSATASAVGGNGGYTYMWSPSGQTTANLSGVGAGTYQVTITDNRNCSSISTVVISQPAILTASISSSNNINCRNENTGSATVSSTGGSGSNTYAWSPSGGNGTTASGLIAGTYSVVVTDINGCSVQTSVTLTQPANILTISNTVVVNPGCVPNNNGSIKITASGGTVPAYNYQLNSGSFQLLDSFGSLVVGNYTLTVRDGNNCTTSSVVSLVNPLTPTVIGTVVDSVSCNGLSNGSATANISGGTSPYTYLWSPSGQTNATAINLIAGTYQVTGTDINGCSATSTVIITQPPVLAASIGTPTHITCFGLLNGSATASAVGGNGGYTYLWSPSGQTTANLSGVGAGTYQVTITDNRNCSSISTVVISQPAILTASISSSNNINCRNENTGSATVSSTGGSGSNTYAWSPSGGNGTTASGLIAGTYSVVVTDINGCSAQTSVTLTQPANILTISNTVVVNPGCVPNNNGSIKITASGGTVPAYNYQLNSGSFQLLDSFGSLVVGNYTLTVRDGNNCTASSVVSLVNPLLPTISATIVDSIKCFSDNNGALTAQLSSGTSPYTYSWNGGASQNNGLYSNLTSGTYTVVGTDFNGCSVSTTIQLFDPAILQASIVNPIHLNCKGDSNGSATATGIGGTGFYTYSWNTTPPQLTSNANNLKAGTYIVTITDANLCTSTASITITEPTLLVATISSSTNINCFGDSTGSATVVASGGAGGYGYIWSDGNAQGGTTATNLSSGTYTVIVTDANGCQSTTSVTLTQPAFQLLAGATTFVNPGCVPNNNGSITTSATGGTGAGTYSYQLNSNGYQSNNIFNSLTAGNYLVTVRDANNCTTITNISLINPLLPTISASIVDSIKCFGDNNGALTAQLSSGTSPYTYSWNGGASQNNGLHSNLTSGTYTVVGTDFNGCSVSATIQLFDPAILQASIVNPIHLNCKGDSNGSATATGIGGTGFYTYSWNTTPPQLTSNANNLKAGTYIVTITDANLCTSTASITITEPTLLVATISSSTNINCFGDSTGSATVVASGGAGGYGYIWSDGNAQGGTTATNLSSGTYTVIVTDANGCQSTTSVTLTQPAFQLLAGATTFVNPGCVPNNNGSITTSATGGTGVGTYSYQLNSNGYQSNNIFDSLTAGNYLVTIRDANNCTTTTNVVLVNPLLPTISATIVDSIKCFGDNNGALTAQLSSGTSPYTYSWNGGASQNNGLYSNLTSGTYTIVGTDFNGCSVSTTIQLFDPAILQASIVNPIHLNCKGDSNGSATATGIGGTGFYTYSWNTTPPQLTSNANNLKAGTYIVTITDANLCTSTASITITEPTLLVATISSSTNINCFGDSTGSATVVASGGAGGYGYIWSDGNAQSGTTATNLSSGTYTVIVTDANGCQSTTSVTLTQPAFQLLAGATTFVNPGCVPNNNGSITTSATGGTGVGTYSYQLNSNGYQSNNIFNSLTAGNYLVTIRDANNCTTTTNVVLVNPLLPTISATIVDSIKCFGDNNGALTAQLSSGTSPYTYSWNGGASQNNGLYSNLTSGIYTVVGTDFNGCSVSATIQLFDPAILQASIVNPIHLNCKGDSNGSATATGIGGTGFYTYSWNTTPPQLTSNANNLKAGTYIVTITDANLCTSTASITITEPTLLVATISSSTNINCFGDSTGSATVVASGGTGGYGYIWSDGNAQGGATATNLSSGTYSVVVTDANGCIASTSVTLTQPNAPLSIDSIALVQPGCNPNNNGSITFFISGGTSGYNYQLNTGAIQSSNIFDSLIAGNYTITGIDSKGCTISTIVVLTTPALPSVSIQVFDSISCFGANDGALLATGVGVNVPLTYLWATIPPDFDSLTAGLVAGIYEVMVTDALGCTVTSTLALGQPTQVILNIISLSNPTIFGLANGAVNSSANGGTPGYTYNLFDNNGILIGTNTNGQFGSLPEGTYWIQAIDFNNCSDTESFVLIAPLPLDIVLLDSLANPCFGDAKGEANFIITGGIKPYTVQILPSAANTLNVDSLHLFNLLTGTYSVTITDFAGATTMSEVTITQPPLLVLDSLIKFDPYCVPSDNGFITGYPSGGTTTYSYTLLSSGIPKNQLTNSFTNLFADNYTFVVTDANGCSVSSSIALIKPNDPIINSYATTQEWCLPAANGTIITNATSFNGSLLYGLSLATLSSNDTIFNLAANNYTVYVQDSLFCIDTALVTISHVPLFTSISIDTSYASCDPGGDGTILVTTTGATSPFTYQANTITQSNNFFTALSTGIYNVTVSDVYGCTITSTAEIASPAAPIFGTITINQPTCAGFMNGSIIIGPVAGVGAITFLIDSLNLPSSSGIYSGVGAGTYTIIAKDAAGCTTSTIVIVSEPLPLGIVNLVNNPVLCFGTATGSISVGGSGGTVPYDFALSGQTNNTTGIFNNLIAGNYTLGITDANSCAVSSVVVVTSPPVVNVALTFVKGVTCFGANDGTIVALATGGTPNYTYSVDTFTSITGNFNQLIAGNYTVIATDNNNCTSTTTFTITSPTKVVIDSVTLILPKCFGDSNGQILLSAQGGTGILNYNINAGVYGTTNLFSFLPTGNYTLGVRDQNNCLADTTVFLNQPTVVKLDSITFEHLKCFQSNDGLIIADASGGTPFYQYVLLPIGTVNAAGLFNNLSADTYTIVVEDANACSATSSVVITEPTLLEFSNIAVQNLKCNNEADGSIDIIMTGGTFPYSFNLQPNGIVSSNGLFTNMSAGTFSITVTDANNCSVSTVVTLSQPPLIVIGNIALSHIKCAGEKTGEITGSATGGTGTLVYQLLNYTLPNLTGAFNQLPAGTYTFQVTDANSCTKASVVTLTENPRILIDSILLTMPLCQGQANGSIYISAIGGVGQLSYQFNGNNYLNYVWQTGLSTNTYPLLVTDAIGCVLDTAIFLGEPGKLTIIAKEEQNNICLGNKTGIASVVANGGTPPFIYVVTPIFTTTTLDTIYNLGSGNYTITAIDANKCLYTTTFTISTDTNAVSFKTNIIGVSCTNRGTDGRIEAIPEGGQPPFAFIWNNGPKTTESIFDNLQWGDYTVTVIDEKGCSASDTVTVPVAPCCQVYLPNVFTPNGDNNNDEFKPISGAGYQIKTFGIYDRWGNQIFSTNELDKGWDGTYKGAPMNMDTYFAIFIYRCIYDNKTYMIKTDLTLLRK